MSGQPASALPFNETLLIIGTGLMGTSVALAARRAGICKHILGIDPNAEANQKALEIGAIDKISSLESALDTSDCVIISVPPAEVLTVLKSVIPLAKEGALIMDLASVKEPILEQVDEFCPLAIHYISVHPMAGRELYGPEAAQENLFQDAPLFLVPSLSTRPEAMERAEAFWSALGARVYQALPADHDTIVAGASHLPQLISFALTSTLKELYPDLQELRQFAGTGLKGMTRISRSSPELWSQIFQMNDINLALASSHFRQCLKSFEDALETARKGNSGPLDILLREAHLSGISLSEGPEA